MKRILFIGDIVGNPGRTIIKDKLQTLRDQLQLDFVIANAENTAGGAGLTQALAEELLKAGIDALTLGDHVWDQRGFEQAIDGLEQVCRPANLPTECPGRPYLILNKAGFRLGVVTVLGRQFMHLHAACPFKTVDALLQKLQPLVDACVVEVHAEATSEKLALGHYLDGRVALVVGTHTHVPTADACLLPLGTAYITDVGMTGPYASIIGRSIEPVIRKFITGMPQKFSVATNSIRLSGCLLTLEESTKKPVDMQLYQVNLH